MTPEPMESEPAFAGEPESTPQGVHFPSPINEDLALAELANRDVRPEVLQQIARTAGLLKSRKVRLALASHPRTPRRTSLRLIRELYNLELMQFAQLPSAPPDLRRVADDLLIARAASITLGERISLARRSSEKVAGVLLLDKEPRVWQTALENARLTEAGVVKALWRGGTPLFVESVSHHAKWSLRHEVRVALLRNAHTPLARALEFARRLPRRQLRDILHSSRLPQKIKEYLRNHAEEN